MTVLRADVNPVRFSDVKWRIYGNFDGTNWEDISRDVLDGEGVAWDRGMPGGGPNDRTAQSGTLTFTLNSSEVNSVGIRGFWATSTLVHKQGWDVGTPLRLDIAYKGRWVTQWIGRADEITPEHGILNGRRVFVKAKDWMEEAAEHELTGLETLVNVTAPEIIEEMLSVIPIQPPGGTILDDGLDVYPIAFDDVRDGETVAMTVLASLARSGLDYIFVTKSGALRYQNRNSRLASTHNLFVLDGTMKDVTVGRARKNIINRVQVTVHPRRVGDEHVVLFSLEDEPLLAPGESITLRGDYTDPDNPGERIGAVDPQVPLEAGVDYTASLETSAGVGDPDSFTAINPTESGFYDTFLLGSGSSKETAVSDDSDATYDIPIAGFNSYQTWKFGHITAPDVAAVAGVKLVVRYEHFGTGTGFSTVYPRMRLNGIDLNAQAAGTYTPGVNGAVFEFPERPGGGAWTAGDINGGTFEAGIAFNWGVAEYGQGTIDQVPRLLKISVQLLFASDVSAADRTANFSVVTVAGGNSAEFTVTNNGSDSAYLTKLQVRGRPVFEYEPVTSSVQDAASIQQYGKSPVSIDQSFQANVKRGVLSAEYLLYLYGPRADRADRVDFVANLSEEHMNAALDREIGDRIGLIEKMSGLSASTADGDPSGWYIQSIGGRISPGPVIDIAWGLAPADATQYWLAGIEGQSEAGETTVAGPL